MYCVCVCVGMASQFASRHMTHNFQEQQYTGKDKYDIGINLGGKSNSKDGLFCPKVIAIDELKASGNSGENCLGSPCQFL